MPLDEQGRWPLWAAVINVALIDGFLWAAIYCVVRTVLGI